MTRSVKISGVLIAVITVLIIALPLVARYVLVDYLVQKGSEDAAVGSIRINPFLARVTLRELQAGTDTGRALTVGRLMVDLSWLDLVLGRIHLEGFSLEDAIADVEQDEAGIRVGELLFATNRPEEAGEVGDLPPMGISDVSITGTTLSWRDGYLEETLVIEDMTLQDALQWRPDEPTQFGFDGQLTGGRVTAEAQGSIFDDPGQFSVSFEANELSLAEIHYLMPDQFSGLAGLVEAKGSAGFTLAEDGVHMRFETTASVSDAKLAAADIALGAKTLQLAVKGKGPVMSPEISAGSLVLDGVSLNLAHPSAPRPLFAAASISVEGLSIASTGNMNQVSLESVSITQPEMHVLRTTGGALNYREMATRGASLAGETDTDTTAQDTQRPVVEFELARFAVSDGRIEIEDRAVTPALLIDFEDISINANGISTNEQAPPASVTMDLRQGSLTRLHIETDVMVAAAKPTADMLLRLEHLELPQFSGYLPGYRIERGRADLRSEGSVAAGVLSLENELIIDELRLKAGERAGGGPVSAALGMPLDVVLDLLRDGDGRIVLEIPVSGDLTRPKVELDDIIETAIASAMQKAAVSYVKTMLAPLGTILLASDLAGKAMRPRFDPVTFEPASSDVSGDASAYLTQVSRLMAERPALKLSVCGSANERDREALSERLQSEAEAEPGQQPANAEITVDDPALIELAKARAEQTINFMVEKADVDRTRFFSCPPEINDEAEVSLRL